MLRTRDRVRRWLSSMLVLTMVLGLLPAGAMAEETPPEQVTVNVEFDYRSVGSAEMLEGCGITVPKNAQATVPAGSSVYEVLENAKPGAFDVTYGDGFDGSPKGFVKAFGGIGDIQTLCTATGAAYSDLYQYAGWTYSGNVVDGMGIQADHVSQSGTITFRYSVYSGNSADNTWTYFDVEFVDAYYRLKADLAAVPTVQDGYTPEQWAVLEAARTEAERAANTVEAEDTDGFLTGGLMLNYITKKGTALWGAGSPTDQLKTARDNLKRAVDKVVNPTSIQVTAQPEITMGTDHRIACQVLPEGAPQEVTYDILLGGESFTLTSEGVVTPKAACNLCMVQIKSAENPNVSATFKFKIVEAPVAPPVAPPVAEKADALLASIAASYTEHKGQWQVMDMGAYALINPQGAKLSAEARQTFLTQSIDRLSAENVKDTDYAKDILALKSQGIDPAQLYAKGSESPLNAYAGLDGVTHSTSLWNAPYVLMAYHQNGGQAGNAHYDTLKQAILSAQRADGSWDEFGTLDVTGNVLAALTLDAGDPQVDAAIEKAVNYLSSMQQETGAFGVEPNSSFPTSLNANSTAMVVIGLCAAGVDPHTDPRFIKDGHSALDGLLSFALNDNSGFGWTDNTKLNPGATEQAFRALVAARQVMKTKQAFNVYDFSAVPAQPGYAAQFANCPVTITTVPEGGEVTVQDSQGVVQTQVAGIYDLAAGTYSCTVTKSGYRSKTETFVVTAEEAVAHTRKELRVSLSAKPPVEEKTVTITVYVMAPPADTSKKYTYKHDKSAYTDLITGKHAVKLDRYSTGRDALIAVLDDAGIPYVEKSDGYFESIGDLAALDRGKESGWMYMVDRRVPNVSCKDYQFSTDATMIWFYTDDYTSDYGSESWGGGSVPVQPEAPTQPTVREKNDGSFAVTIPEKTRNTPNIISIPSGRPGQVAVIVHSDGREEAVKKSVVSYGSTTLVLKEDATIKLVDRDITYPDVTGEDWFAGYVDFVSDRGIFKGTPSGFAPYENMSRAMAVTVLMNLEDGKAKGQASFTDVGNIWYSEAVAWAVEQKITSGVGNGRFDPDHALTRQEMAQMLFRYIQSLGIETSTIGSLNRFTDSASAAPWAVNALTWATQAGVMNGCGDGTLNPNGLITRAEASAMLQNTVAILVKAA